MKKTLGIRVLSMLTLLSIASCGRTTEEKVDESNYDTVLTVEVLQGGFGRDCYEAVGKAFMAKHPDVLVKYTYNPDINSQTATKLSSGKNLKDIYCVRSIKDIMNWSIQGYVEDLSDLYHSEVENGKTILDKMDPMAAEYSEYQGKYYSIPEYYSIDGVVYNRKLFEKNSWSIPTTINDFRTLCDQIGETSISPLVYCGARADGYLYFPTDNIMDAYEGVANLDKFYRFESADVFKPENSVGKLYGLTFLTDFMFNSSYTYSRSATLTHTNAQSMLIQDKAAMMFNGSWFTNEMKNTIAAAKNFEAGIFPCPYPADANNQPLHAEGYTCEDNKPVIDASIGASYFIPKQAKNKEMAKEFLKFMETEEACEIYTQNSCAVRPFDYDKDPTSDTYKDLSSFGKDILNIASTHTLYIPRSKAQIYLEGQTGLWARGNYYFEDLRDNGKTPEQCLEEDYRQAQMKFKN